MSEEVAGETLSPRLDAKLQTLLARLQTCRHHLPELVSRSPLPAWSHSSLFYFLGYIARAEGRVRQDDIDFAQALMQALAMNGARRRRAIGHFHRGRDANQPASYRGLVLRTTRSLLAGHAILVSLCLAHACQLQGPPSRSRRYRCEDCLDQMGLPVALLDIIFGEYRRNVWANEPARTVLPETYSAACKTLGGQAGDDLASLKRAYRRKVAQCHPDKIGSDLPAYELAAAKDQLLRYQKAWELIKRRQDT